MKDKYMNIMFKYKDYCFCFKGLEKVENEPYPVIQLNDNYLKMFINNLTIMYNKYHGQGKQRSDKE